MTLLRSTAALQRCRQHINSLPTTDAEIEAILAAYACAVIYAELEAEIVRAVADRAAHNVVDKRIVNWASGSARQLIRSIKVGELSGIAGRFDPQCKEHFKKNLDAEAVAAWDQIATNRHATAHEDATNQAISTLTFGETESAFGKVQEVLDCFTACLHAALN